MEEIKRILGESHAYAQMRWETDPATVEQIKYLRNLMSGLPERAEKEVTSGINFNLLTKAEAAKWIGEFR